MRLSPAELSYLHSSLTATPPLRPDLRALTAFRPRSLQTDFLATANGSARITGAGGDVLVVIKAQIGDAVELAPGLFGGQISVDVYIPVTSFLLWGWG
jgi:exosome complex RNA-binding protein Rrp42 (RNase PH superfamily)